MKADVYIKLREMLDTIPNGFPSTESGVELKILKSIFTEEEAQLYTSLKMNMETVEQIAARTGLDREYLKRILKQMYDKGQLFSFSVGEISFYRVLPFIFGIYEFQLPRMDREMAALFDEYMAAAFHREFFSHRPALMKVIPIEEEVPPGSIVEPYESAAALIDGAKSWAVNECICKKEQGLLAHPCTKPLEVCLAMAPVENAFTDSRFGRAISKDEAHRILKMSEEAGLVHMTSNYRSGHFYICNCCSCCCGPLRGYAIAGRSAVAQSNYIAVVDPEACTGCGTCVERCQVHGIELADTAVIRECIGCGLCVTTCPAGALRLERRPTADIIPVPEGEREWLDERAASRGIGSDYKKYLD